MKDKGVLKVPKIPNVIVTQVAWDGFSEGIEGYFKK